jgi:hypothetical protein
MTKPALQGGLANIQPELGNSCMNNMSIPHLPSIWQPLFRGRADARLRLVPAAFGRAEEAPPMPTPWTNRIWLEYRAGNLTRAARDVLFTLHTFRGTGGAAWPSHATLADRARCCVRTVQRALAQAQALGLVSWAERRVRAGWRWLRSSNLYRFVVPADAVSSCDHVRLAVAPCYRQKATTGHCGRGGESQNKKEARDELLRAAAAAPDLLAMRRAAFTGGHIRTARMA